VESLGENSAKPLSRLAAGVMSFGRTELGKEAIAISAQAVRGLR